MIPPERPRTKGRGGAARRGLRVGLALFGAVSAGAAVASAQSVTGAARSADELSSSCVQLGGMPSSCAASAVAVRAAAGQLGLLVGAGSEVPGTATTLGTRIAGGPRLSFFVRVAAIDAGLPDFRDPSGAGELRGTPTTVQVGGAAGLFEGFRLMPTVGGFLSLDAFGRASLLRLPEGLGYASAERAFTGGVRVGVFREGFTIPGVSVSASRSWVGRTEGGTTADPASWVVDPRITSLRATVGKDLYAVEVLAGAGWDRYEGDVVVRATDGVGGRAVQTARLRESRRIYFASAAMTFSILLTVSVEGGWARGFDQVTSYTGVHDPTASSLFGGLTFRLTL